MIGAKESQLPPIEQCSGEKHSGTKQKERQQYDSLSIETSGLFGGIKPGGRDIGILL